MHLLTMFGFLCLTWLHNKYKTPHGKQLAEKLIKHLSSKNTISKHICKDITNHFLISHINELCLST